MLVTTKFVVITVKNGVFEENNFQIDVMKLN